MNTAFSLWLAQLHASINRPPATPRLPLVWAGKEIGSVDADAFGDFVHQTGVAGVVQLAPGASAGVFSWQLLGEPTAALMQLANAMRHVDYARVSRLWRDEPLAVRSVNGELLATVERGAVRALGISTQGVHLHGYTGNMAVWIQQRAFNKATEPGQWDTLMGGMVSSNDSLAAALARETFEEAGLHIEQVQDLHYVDHFIMRAPSATDSGLGYVVERIDWFECLLSDLVIPTNTDGEVQQFNLIDTQDLRRMLMNGDFTPEAAVILGTWLKMKF